MPADRNVPYSRNRVIFQLDQACTALGNIGQRKGIGKTAVHIRFRISQRARNCVQCTCNAVDSGLLFVIQAGTGYPLIGSTGG